MLIAIKKADCINVGKALQLEWLDTNGIGGYASSSILNCHTRRYHGILVARLANPAGRYVLLSKFEDSLFQGDRELFLSVHRYPGVVFPRGHKFLAEFRLGEVPRFKFTVGGTHVVKRIALVEGQNTVLVAYSATKNRANVKLRIRPLLAFRDFHALTWENVALRVRTFPARDGFEISPYEGMPSLFVQVRGAHEFYPAPTWYRSFDYLKEQVRGFDHREDLFSPGTFEIDFPEGGEVFVSASTEEQTEDLERLWNAELARREKHGHARGGTRLRNVLAPAARQFVVEERPGQKSIVAGYPWFIGWGRDAMISLPGLISRSDKTSTYLSVLSTFAEQEKDGLIPNVVGETPATNSYNSVDASLWFAWAIQKYVARAGSPKAVPEELYSTLVRIFTGYREGTRFGISMLPSGLLTAGSDDVQVTWMDATVDGKPVTPRSGCAVEVNALWYNMLRFLAALGDRYVGPAAEQAGRIAEGIPAVFLEAFWMPAEGRLADVMRDGVRDESMRPNQLFAVSMPYSPLPTDEARSVVRRVGKELLTPFGLRTLSPADPRYVGRYTGGPAERDRAYHNGTVWPWLLGSWGEALLKVSEEKQSAVTDIERILKGFEAHILDAGLGSISEVFDGDPPHSPGGCVSQAWSVAEILRLARMVEAEKRRIAAARRVEDHAATGGGQCES